MARKTTPEPEPKRWLGLQLFAITLAITLLSLRLASEIGPVESRGQHVALWVGIAERGDELFLAAARMQSTQPATLRGKQTGAEIRRPVADHDDRERQADQGGLRSRQVGAFVHECGIRAQNT